MSRVLSALQLVMSHLCFREDSVKQDLKTETPSDRAGAFLDNKSFFSVEASLGMLNRSKSSISLSSSDVPWPVNYSHICCLSVLAWAGPASGTA